ncbi:Sterol O-acyltransferase 2 (Sterol-ester synthase 2) [Coemansia spiralis]|uniref:O-acyltransferase n=2 Tax=Coemansia TaxID=4863 RepID=A0A9W8G2R5_9FUNG|nr:MBOAT, membrane-bound O-acyltransferase family-domain-containing protein [Coemansia spiralis]KAJ1992163.1 Sterol O-acyltransferase 2 (Sterol-ester synthase 2) [Coemansia umbellata]KAJ2622016.1 Sterol O-acyltransferase 2 (Sterol-ester synthase 2) [Coemansia sp. RSA 1358]KAJ2677620.1 Sterol O-acyltransferase 2 (Sterol-ester synthase 2) [Coemansia spiralis]
MFISQAATKPPSSRESPSLSPEQIRGELEGSQERGFPLPVYTPSLHRALRNDNEQLLHQRRPHETDAESATPHKEDATAKSASPDGDRKSAIFFAPRTSILDYTELMYHGSDTIRGLVTCFWTIVGAYLISLLVANYESSGEFLSRNLAASIFSRGKDLLLSDLALVASTFFVVPFVRVLWVGGWQPAFLDPRSGSSVLLHAVAEIGWLVFWYGWQGSRDWPWAQRCFFSLHTAVNWMKVHSYLSTNRNLACVLCNKTDLVAQRGSCKEGDEHIQEEVEKLDAELCPYSNARFPETLTVSNYLMFQLCPALVYELEYPRTPRIRWLYVAEKMAGTAGIFVVFYVVVAHLMIPHLERMPETGVLLTTVHLMGPMATCWLLFFFITFDSISNGFAELTRFADRRFYDDWWNARGLDEFSRKWNRPVHLFLARHIYMPVRANWRIYKSSKDGSAKNQTRVGGLVRRLRITVPAPMAAMAATFFFSSILHEVTVVVACHRWNHGMLFFSQMMQIPMIYMSGKMVWYKNQHALRNWIFWVLMVFFQPLLLCLYTYQAFANRTALNTTLAAPPFAS